MHANHASDGQIGKRTNPFGLREPGVLTESARVFRADSGAAMTLKELLSCDGRGVVWSLDDRLRFVPQLLESVLPCGSREITAIRLASGRSVELVPESRPLTIEGWRQLAALAVDDRIAVPRRIPAPVQVVEMPSPEVILLAHMIGDGSCVKRQPIRYASIDEENLAAVTAAAAHFGITAVRDEYAAARVTTLRLPAPYRLTHGRRNPIAAWLDELGLFGLRSYEKFIPASVFALPTEDVAIFLRHLWATDGSIRWDERGRQARIYYASTSLRLINDVANLLLRLEIHGRIKRVQKAGYRDCWHLTVDGAENQCTFLTNIGAHGLRGVAGEAALAKLELMNRNTNVDTVPKEIWDKVRALLSKRGMTHRQFQSEMGSQFCGSTMWKHSPSRDRLARAARILDAPDLALLCTSEVFWDRITEITHLGVQEVFSATVCGTGNLVADGVVVSAGV
ncbi:LAGLIDADG family homing endonuclease [Nocardia sp. CDC160]|uniref:LAGLIDADG family homing endonuclease n=1 Tax=Nocardia sp. CDC160 TaxID=3112166 RepID=UPI002DBA45EE|nr:LAGLIDADG family homing endonuclease [Nocardia sp. CDC160]MEC3914271.1 LAGLIDADG family homing endonuclease [Nocardia sp. CDC160]